MLSGKRCFKLGRLLAGALCLGAAVFVLSACSAAESEWKDGYFTAEAADFDAYGWKEYVTLCVSGGRIVNVEYNAKNASGLVKSWDMDYMREMNATDRTYPNYYTRVYSEELRTWQDPDRVNVIAGATHSHTTFRQLALAAIEKARAGDKSIAYVEFLEDG